MADHVVIDREEPKEVEMDFNHYVKRQLSAVSNQRNFALALIILSFLICSYIPTLRDDFVFGNNAIVSHAQGNASVSGPSPEELLSVSKNNLANIMKELEAHKKKSAEDLQKRSLEWEAKLDKVQSAVTGLATREAALKDSAKALADQQAQLHKSTASLPVVPPLVCDTSPPVSGDVPADLQENREVTRLLGELKTLNDQLAGLRNERDKVKSVHALSKSLASEVRSVDGKVTGLQQTIDTLQRSTRESLAAVVVPTVTSSEEVKPLDEAEVSARIKKEAEQLLAAQPKKTSTSPKSKTSPPSTTATVVPSAAAAAAPPAIPSLDFALHSAGAIILNSSETYFPAALGVEQRVKSALSAVGLDALSQYVPDNVSGGREFYDRLKLNPGVGEPKDAISLGLAPGQCWPMEGSKGELVVQLSEAVKVESISIDHISGINAKNIDSAPQRFEVYARESANGKDKLIVEGVYDIHNSENTQNFVVKAAVDRPVRIVTLKVLSNSGNPDYTCLYRFRVHGVPATR